MKRYPTVFTLWKYLSIPFAIAIYYPIHNTNEPGIFRDVLIVTVFAGVIFLAGVIGNLIIKK